MIIVGLGNFGAEYENTFHNMGFMAVDALANLFGKSIDKIECNSLTCVKSIKNENIVFAKPLTYMNNSGQAVASLLAKYNQSPEDLIIIYDDIDISRFSVRIRNKGSAGTHNGMRSVIKHVKSENFLRVRIGIGKNEYDLKDYVLSTIKKEDKLLFDKVFESVSKILYEYVLYRDKDKLTREGNVINYGIK